MLIQILILGLLLIVVPAIVGMLFAGVDESVPKLPFWWISGQVLLWAVFQLVSVPFILASRSFSSVVFVFNCLTVVLVLGAVAYYAVIRKQHRSKLRLVETADLKARILWVIFGVLLAVQVVCAIFLAYSEGDDAFYVATSTIVSEADSMYAILPYTGFTTGLDVRHGLAPFPVWVAYLARMSGMPAVTVAQIALPLVLIVMCYGLYYCVGKVLLSGRQRFLPFFMILVEVMVLFGGYTTYSAENFLLVRTAQGKAVLAAILIPFLFLLLYLLVEKLQKEEKIKLRDWILLWVVQTACCLCSTLGTVLTCLLVAIVGLCVLLCYKKWKLLIPMAASCIPPVCYAAIYFLVG